MDTIARRAFFGVAGLGAVAEAAASAEGAASEAGEYGRVSRPIVVGIGRGQAASLTLVWLPRDAQRPSLKTRLAIFDLGGKVLAERDVVLAPFTGVEVFDTSSGQASPVAAPTTIA